MKFPKEKDPKTKNKHKNDLAENFQMGNCRDINGNYLEHKGINLNSSVYFMNQNKQHNDKCHLLVFVELMDKNQ